MLKVSVLVVRSCALFATLTRSCRLSVRSQLVVGAPSTLRPALSKFSERTGSVLGAQAWCDRGIKHIVIQTAAAELAAAVCITSHFNNH